MALYWVSYRRDRLLAGAVIVEANSPCHARKLVSVRWADRNLEFTEGKALDACQAAQLSANAKDQLLSLMEAHRLSRRFEQEQCRMRSALQAENSWPRNAA